MGLDTRLEAALEGPSAASRLDVSSHEEMSTTPYTVIISSDSGLQRAAAQDSLLQASKLASIAAGVHAGKQEDANAAESVSFGLSVGTVTSTEVQPTEVQPGKGQAPTGRVTGPSAAASHDSATVGTSQRPPKSERPQPADAKQAVPPQQVSPQSSMLQLHMAVVAVGALVAFAAGVLVGIPLGEARQARRTAPRTAAGSDRGLADVSAVASITAPASGKNDGCKGEATPSNLSSGSAGAAAADTPAQGASTEAARAPPAAGRAPSTDRGLGDSAAAAGGSTTRTDLEPCSAQRLQLHTLAGTTEQSGGHTLPLGKAAEGTDSTVDASGAVLTGPGGTGKRRRDEPQSLAGSGLVAPLVEGAAESEVPAPVEPRRQVLTGAGGLEGRGPQAPQQHQQEQQQQLARLRGAVREHYADADAEGRGFGEGADGSVVVSSSGVASCSGAGALDEPVTPVRRRRLEGPAGCAHQSATPAASEATVGMPTPWAFAAAVHGANGGACEQTPCSSLAASSSASHAFGAGGGGAAAATPESGGVFAAAAALLAERATSAQRPAERKALTLAADTLRRQQLQQQQPLEQSAAAAAAAAGAGASPGPGSSMQPTSPRQPHRRTVRHASCRERQPSATEQSVGSPLSSQAPPCVGPGRQPPAHAGADRAPTGSEASIGDSIPSAAAGASLPQPSFCATPESVPCGAAARPLSAEGGPEASGGQGPWGLAGVQAPYPNQQYTHEDQARYASAGGSAPGAAFGQALVPLPGGGVGNSWGPMMAYPAGAAAGGAAGALLLPPQMQMQMQMSVLDRQALMVLVEAITEGFNRANAQSTAQVTSAISQVTSAVQQLHGDVRSVVEGKQLKQQRHMAAVAMQRGMAVMWVTVLGGSLWRGRVWEVYMRCSVDYVVSAAQDAAAAAAAAPSRWSFARLAMWGTKAAARAAVGGGGGGSGHFATAAAASRWLGGGGWLPSWLRQAMCYGHELGLFSLGLLVCYLVLPLLRRTLALDLQRSWALDVPLIFGGVWAAVGAWIVHSLGGMWTLWLAAWWAWCAAGMFLHATRLRGAAAQAAAVWALAALAVPVGLLPYATCARPAHFLLEAAWWGACRWWGRRGPWLWADAAAAGMAAAGGFDAAGVGE